MLMEELFERLRKFQDLLMERVSLEKQVKELPKSILAQEEVLVRAKKSLVEKQQRFDDLTAKVANTKQELEEVVDHKNKSEQQMDSISSPREFEALNKEITEAGLKEDRLRKEFKASDEALKEAVSELNSTQMLISSQESEVTEKRNRIQSEESTMSQRINELKNLEAEITSSIDREIIFKFERIIKSKQSLGIVSVKGSVCTGCSMILPAQFVNEVRQGNKVVFCPYCSRVLFHQESDGTDDDLLIDIESGSLAEFDDFSDDSEEDSYDDDDDDGQGKGSMEDSDD
ncbi:MAG: nucleic acid-binding protein [Spirochaetes bacterium]|nr:nucleic acid-binding protein [Spirochaetota bacterium]